MGLTVGELREYLAGMPASAPVVVDVNAGRWYLRAENVYVTSDENATDDATDVEVQLTWEPDGDGWALVGGADSTRSSDEWPFRTSIF